MTSPVCIPDATYWLQFPQPLATAILGIGAAVLGYFQWRTGHNKLVLDLFQQRMKVYSAMQELLREVLRNGAQGATPQLVQEFRVASADVQFLFGDEVEARVETIRGTLQTMRRDEVRLGENHSQTIRTEQLNERVDQNFEIIQVFCTHLPKLISPYVRMDQRRV